MVCTSICRRWLVAACAAISIVSAQDTAKTASSKSLPKSITLSYELFSNSPASAKPLATVNYDPRSLESTLSSWTPPLAELEQLKSTSTEPVSAPLLRLLLPSGASTIVSLSSFDPALSQDINIWLAPHDGSVLSASITSKVPPPLSAEEELLRQKEERLRKRGKPVPPRPKPSGSKAKKAAAAAVAAEEHAGPVVKVNLRVAGSGPRVKWNTRAAPQLDAEGKEIVQEEVQEKTFLQKYWYILLAVAFVLMTGGGGGEK